MPLRCIVRQGIDRGVQTVQRVWTPWRLVDLTEGSDDPACALAVDVSGPHHAEAEDQEVRNPKYFLVGAYTFPKFRPKLPEVVEDAPIPNLEESAGLLDEATADGTPGEWEYGVGEGCAKDLTAASQVGRGQ